MLRVFRYGLFAMVATIVSGCATVELTDPSGPPASETSETMLDQKIDALLAEQREICMSPEYAALRNKNPCSNSDITFALLADRSKITNNERSQMIAAYTRMDKVYKEITSLYQAHASEAALKVAQARTWAYDQSMKNRLNLVNGGITWGQYLDRRMQISSEMMNRAQ